MKIIILDGNIEIYEKPKNYKLDAFHENIIQEHLQLDLLTCTKLQGMVSGKPQELLIELSNVEKVSQLMIALVDELGEYFSTDTLVELIEGTTFQMSLSKYPRDLAKKVTILVAMKLNEGSVAKDRVYELELINDQSEQDSRFKEFQIG